MLISILDILCTHLIRVCSVLCLVSDKQIDCRQGERERKKIRCMYMQPCPPTHLTALLKLRPLSLFATLAEQSLS